MKSHKIFRIFSLLLNIAGLACFIHFGFLYITHNTHIANPDAMLAMEAWDGAGICLIIGFFPLLIANVLGSLCVKKNKLFKFACFLPSILCLAMALCYIFLS